MELLSAVLTDPKLWSILTPAGILVIILGYTIWKLFRLYSDLQEKRIAEFKEMNREYTALANEINRTLDTVLKLIGNKSNGGSKDGH